MGTNSKKAAASDKGQVQTAPEKKESTKVKGSELSAENMAFAKKILAQKPDLEAVYVCGGLFFSEELRAKCYSDSNGSEVFTVKRD